MKNRTVTELHAIPKPKLTEKDHSFFSTLAEAVSVFKFCDLPGANCNGCIVSPVNGKRSIRFIFAIAYARTVEVEIDMDSLQASPGEYIEYMLELINEGCKEAAIVLDSRIQIPVGNNLYRAVKAANDSVIH